MNNSNNVGYLDQRLFDATLADVQQAKLDLDRNGPFGSALHRFLNVGPNDSYYVSSMHPEYDLPQIHLALGHCFAHWSLLHVMGPPQRRCPWFPEKRQIQTGPSAHQQFLVNGSQWYALPCGERRVVFIEADIGHKGECRCTIVGPRRCSDQLDQEIGRFRVMMDQGHYLRGQTIDSKGNVLSIATDICWESVHLAPGIRERLFTNTRHFLQHRPTFQKAGAPWKRGILLYGPPGTGKTMIGKALASEGLATFIYATAADCRQPDDVKELFRLGRRLQPTILFFEDLDLFAEERRGSFVDSALGELLAQMDGLFNNNGLIVMATTNDLSVIDEALSDRPSRFDVLLEVGLPDDTSRRGILAQQLRMLCVSDETLDALVASTQGASGARVREVAVALVQVVLLRCCSDDPSDWIAEPEDVRHALQCAIGQPEERQRVGFRGSVLAAANAEGKV